MTRQVTGGMGAAPVGGTYTLDEPDQFSVDGSRATVRLAPGADRSARVSVGGQDVESRVKFRLSAIPSSGSGVYIAQTARRDAKGNEYRIRARVVPGGSAYLSVRRMVDGKPADIGTETAVGRVTAGTDYWLATSAVGTTQVTLAVKMWPVGSTEPGWMHRVTDSSGSRLSAAGSVGLWWYVSGSGSSTAVTFDDWTAQDVGGGTAQPPEPTPEPTPTPTAPAAPQPQQGSAGAALPIQYSLGSLAGTKYFVSPTGSDGAAGTQAAPLRTVAAALAKVPNGASATVVVRGGLYREGNLRIPTGRSIRVIAYPGETPTFRGSESMSSGWVAAGSLSYHAYSPQPVTNASGISFTSGQGLTGDGVGRYPDQVWVGSQQLRQVSSKSAVVSGTFWVDASNKRVYLAGADVSKGQVEVSRLDVFLTIQGAGSAVEGVRIERFSNSADDYGVVKLLGTADSAVLRDVVITDSAFQALMLAGEESSAGILRDVTLERVTIARANWMGISANMVEDVAMKRLLIEGSNPFKEFSDAPQSGAYKGSRNRGVSLVDSVIRSNNGHGVWFDQSSYDLEVAGNEFLDNSATNLFVEISDRALIVNNYLRSTGTRNLKLAGASGVRLVNNTIVGGADPVGVYVDSRSKPGCADPAKPLCSGSYSTDRDYVRPRPATLDWMPRIDLMLNNIVAYPTGNGYCGSATGLCVTAANGSATAAIQTVVHKAESARGIPQTRIDGNVYANGTGYVSSTSTGRYTSHSAFGTAMSGSPVSIAGVERAGKTGNSWVNRDGTPTSSLVARNGEAVPVPTDPALNLYLPAGTRAYGYIG